MMQYNLILYSPDTVYSVEWHHQSAVICSICIYIPKCVVSLCRCIHTRRRQSVTICYAVLHAVIHVVTANASYIYVTIHCHMHQIQKVIIYMMTFIYINIYVSYILAMTFYYLNPFVGLLILDQCNSSVYVWYKYVWCVNIFMVFNYIHGV